MNNGGKLVRYLIGGLLIGGFWYLNRNRPPWEEVLRTVVVFTVIMALVRVRLRKRGVDVHLVPLIATKAVLVVLAAVFEWALDDRPHQDVSMWVSIALCLAVTIVGAVGDRTFFGPVAGRSATQPAPRFDADRR